MRNEEPRWAASVGAVAVLLVGLLIDLVYMITKTVIARGALDHHDDLSEYS